MTMTIKTGLFSAAGFMILAGSAQAQTTATFTADNHYAIYGEYNGTLELIGANEPGNAGAPGEYNWSIAETFTFDTPDAIYIAAWSDDIVAQGLVGQFSVNGVDSFTGDAGWEVFATGIELNNNAPAPGAPTVAAQITYADAIDAWDVPFVGFDNVAETAPWGRIADVSTEANWIWQQSSGGQHPLLGNVNHDGFLIFRTNSIPTPGAASLLAFGGIASLRRRRAR